MDQTPLANATGNGGSASRRQRIEQLERRHRQRSDERRRNGELGSKKANQIR